MRNRIFLASSALVIVTGSIWLSYFVLRSPDKGLSVLAGLVPALACVWVIIKSKDDRVFLLKLFVLTLALRWAVAFWISGYHQQLFFGADAITFDTGGKILSQAWQGLGNVDSPYAQRYIGTARPGWGMFYYVGAIYYLLGQNQLAVQLINCAFGAAACIAVYKIAIIVYPRTRVARTAAVLTALSPSMVLWSSQMLKDAPIVLCLCLCTLYALKLRGKFEAQSLILLAAALFCLYSLRNYAFYIMFTAIASSLLFSAKRFTPLRILQGSALVILIGLGLVYFMTGGVSQESLDLKTLQASRVWSAKVANTGYGGEVDITDPQAALGFMPVGLLYVLFAPFPWMISNMRQLITLPELVIWWALVPMLARGYWYALKWRLRESFAICIFTIGLTLSYALFQTNVGTAYRHRAQLYVFFVIFISIGLELRRAAKLKRHAQVVYARPGFAATATGAALAPDRTVAGQVASKSLNGQTYNAGA